MIGVDIFGRKEKYCIKSRTTVTSRFKNICNKTKYYSTRIHCRLNQKGSKRKEQ